MNMATSECSSRCESSWTMYLNELSNSTDNQHYSGEGFQSYHRKGSSSVRVDDNDQEDEDLSMVSDASSGPPHLHGNYYTAVSSLSEDRKRGKETTQTMVKNQHGLCLDDTATSPIPHFSQDNAAVSQNQISQVFSSTRFEGESLPNKHLTLLKSAGKGKPAANFVGKKRQ